MLIVIRIILGVFFIISGLEKILSPAANFQYVIEGYEIFSPASAHAVSLVFPWIELFTGLFIALGLWLRPALLGMLVISMTFIVVVGQAIIRQLPLENCGCFGNLIQLPLQGVIVLDSTIFVLSMFLILNIKKASGFGLDVLYDRSAVPGKTGDGDGDVDKKSLSKGALNKNRPPIRSRGKKPGPPREPGGRRR